MKLKTESLIFDMDGTLWDSAANVAASWNEELRRNGSNVTFTEQDVKSVMGQTMDAIALKFFGDNEPEKGLKLMERCCEYENEYLSIHGGILYDRLEETLKRLSANHRLFIVSNCQSGYIEAFLKFYGFEKYITDHLCWGDNKLPKSENIRLIMEKNHVTDGTYMGDTQLDCNSAYAAGARFIHAAYGFGTADRYDLKIYSFAKLTECVE